MDLGLSPARENGTVKISQKRPRPVLSCLECRRKKLKCSRTMPCVQCTKTSHASRCTYNEYPPSAPSSEVAEDVSQSEDRQRKRKLVESDIPEQQTGTRNPSPGAKITLTSTIQLGIIEDLQSRVEKLEHQLKLHTPDLEYVRHFESDEGYRTKRYNVSSSGVIRLKDSATRYHGQNQKVALLNHFEEARTFMKRLETGSDNPSIIEICNDLASLHQSWSRPPKSIEGEQFQDSTAVLQRMLQLLPSQSACNKLFILYLDNFENELRVIHKPSLLSAVDQFWSSQTTDPLRVSDFVPQMLAILAIASSVDDSSLLEEENSREHGMASTYCDLIAIWLKSLKGKQRLKLATLQTETLLLMAKQSSVGRVKDMWNSTGSLVRSAMTIGLHRDPSESLQIPVFWAELRRRLWYTIVEMDLQISLTCGMPTMVCATDYTCGLPANINDTDLNLEMKYAASPRTSAEWTDCLPQSFLANSLCQRLTAARLLSNIHDGLDYNQIVRQAKGLEKILQELPPPLKFDYVSDEDSQKPGRLLTRVLLDVHVRRAILSLYGPFAQAELGGTNFAEARTGFIRSALAVLCYQDIFDPEFADLDIMASPRYWDLFHICCKNDMMHASLGVCLEIKRWSSKSIPLESSTRAAIERPTSMPLVDSEAPDPVFATWTKSSLTKTVEDNIDPLMRRLGRFGSDPKDLLCLSIVLNSVRTNQSSERKELLMESGIRELVTACQQLLRRRRRSGIRNTDLEAAGNQLTPLSQADIQPVAVPSSFNFGFLADSDFDFGEIDIGFAQDWQLDQIWD